MQSFICDIPFPRACTRFFVEKKKQNIVCDYPGAGDHACSELGRLL
jgi:hypothetical protein